MSYFRKSLGELPSVPSTGGGLVSLFPPEFMAWLTGKNETVADTKMVREKGGVVVPAPLTPAQLPQALKPQEKTLDRGGNGMLKAAAVLGGFGIVGYFIWRHGK
jgi:hypothetical protein